MSKKPLNSYFGGPMNKGLQDYCIVKFLDEIPELFSVDPFLHFDENYLIAKNFWKQFIE